MVGIKYNSLADLNSQAHAWCNKINAKIHGTTNERPIDRLSEENLLPIKREYIIDKINLRRVEKDCLISYAGNKYSVPAEYVGRDVTVIVLDHMLAAYFEGKQIALHKLSYSSNTLNVNKEHYKSMIVKSGFNIENILLNNPDLVDLNEKNTTIFTTNKAFSSWNEVFSDITIASAILDRILHHCQVMSIKGESYRLKERKEMMSNTNTIVNTLFEAGS